MPVYLFVPALILIAVLGGLGSHFFLKSDADIAIDETAKYVAQKIKSTNPNQEEVRKKLINGLQQTNLEEDNELSKKLVCMVTPDFEDGYYCNLPKDIADNAKANFSKITEGLKQIKKELDNKKSKETNNPFKNDSEKEYSISHELGFGVSVLNEAINSGQNNVIQKDEVIYRIYKYQEEKTIKPTGILDKETQEKILNSIANPK